MEDGAAPSCEGRTGHHAVKDLNGSSVHVAVLDSLEKLETAKVEVQLSSSFWSGVILCCTVCRRPLSLECRVSSEFTAEQASRMQICIRNAHDLRSQWLPASYSEASGPPYGGSWRARCMCPNCQRYISLLFSRDSRDVEVHGTSSDLTGVSSTGEEFAYATLLFGSGVDYMIGALVLGWTLLKLLHTADVPLEYLSILSHFWELRSVDYLTGSTRMYCNYSESRFKEVFTKLRALSMFDFAKVLMLDRRNVDELFDLPAPAALKRPGGREQPNHGEPIQAALLWGWRKLQEGEKTRSSDIEGWRYDMAPGINAGVMLLRPDRDVYQRMLSEIADNDHPEHVDCHGPDQEYLGRFFSTFGPGWTHMDARFNYQPLLSRYANQFMRGLNSHEVAIAHFSSSSQAMVWSSC